MATAVISASEAMHYVHALWNGIPVIPATIGVLAFFMVLSIIGIGESSRVAIVIFVTHLVTLSVLVLAAAAYVATNGIGVLVENYALPTEGSVLTALFFGFSAAMLGISGFESSANFVEEQAAGVFPKTLRADKSDKGPLRTALNSPPERARGRRQTEHSHRLAGPDAHVPRDRGQNRIRDAALRADASGLQS